MHSFKKAFIKVTAFVLVFALACTPSIYMYLKYGSQNNNIRSELNQEEGKIDLLFCGASQFVWGIIPEIADQNLKLNSFNISSGLLSMEGRYTILKNVVDKNPVKTVVLDLSYNSLARSDSTETIEGTILLTERLGFKQRVAYTLKNVPLSAGTTYISYVLRTGTYTLLSKLLNPTTEVRNEYAGKGYWGGKAPVSYEGRIYWNEDSYPTYQKYDVDEDTMLWLDKIIKLCQSKNIEMYFVTTPYPTRVISWIDREGILDVHLSLSEKYGYPLYDLNLYKTKHELFDDKTSYFDEEHLSTPGAVICTELLSSLLSENNPGVTNSDKFYNNYAELIDAYFQNQDR